MDAQGPNVSSFTASALELTDFVWTAIVKIAKTNPSLLKLGIKLKQKLLKGTQQRLVKTTLILIKLVIAKGQVAEKNIVSVLKKIDFAQRVANVKAAEICSKLKKH